MGKIIPAAFTALLFFATFSSSSHYGLSNYSVGPAGTSNSHSTTYYTQSNGGEVSSNSASTHYNGPSGGVQAEQLAVPQAPTVSNGSGTYYNQLLVTLNNNAGTSSYPGDVTFSIGVSTSNCFTSACVGSGAVKFVQTGGTLGTSQFYQTYSAWGSGSGTSVVGLTPSTTYYVAVAAEQGTFTNTKYGNAASAATTSPSLTFSVTPSTLSFSSLLPGTTYTSGTVTLSLATNAAYGANVYDAGQYGGLYSALTGNTIPALTGTLSSSSHGFGLQAIGTSQTSGGPLSIDSPYNGSGSTVGTESTSFNPIFSASAAVVGGSATLNMQAKAASNDPAGTDYAEVVTFLAAASF